MHKLLFLITFIVLGQYSLTAQIKDNLEDLNYKKVEKDKDLLDYEETILKNGFFLDGVIQFGENTTVDKLSNWSEYRQGISIGFRLGTKWYFGDMKVYRPGIAAIWGRTNILLLRSISNSGISPMISFAPANVGFANAFSFGGNLGFEINVNFGFNLIVDTQISTPILGYLINPNIKFRFRRLAVGLDVTIMAGDYLGYEYQSFNTLVGLTIGGKF